VKGNLDKAGKQIHEAAAYVKKQSDKVAADSKEGVVKAGEELDKLGDGIKQGTVKSADEIKKCSVSTDHALAKAWHKTAEEIARKGHTAYALDQRGHGDSDWVANGAYDFLDYAADVKVVAAELTRRSGAKPIAIGASLGGIASLLAEGQSERDSGTNVFSALVLALAGSVVVTCSS
jgi:hypothetical protein